MIQAKRPPRNTFESEAMASFAQTFRCSHMYFPCLSDTQRRSHPSQRDKDDIRNGRGEYIYVASFLAKCLARPRNIVASASPNCQLQLAIPAKGKLLCSTHLMMLYFVLQDYSVQACLETRNAKIQDQVTFMLQTFFRPPAQIQTCNMKLGFDVARRSQS